jgi:protoporphyrinogen/coproporphyrinogen III oxidase
MKDTDAREEPRRVIIIGGGIAGLAAAHRLIELREQSGGSFDVLLLEASARTGGSIHTTRRDGFLIEGGADSFISEKLEALNLAKRIGLEAHLIETKANNRRSFIVRGNALRPVPEGFRLLAPSRLWPFVTSDIFSWSGKARVLFDLVLPRRAHADGTDDESLAEFVRRRFGREALERVAQPMVGGIYTADPETLSLRATMPRFLEMECESRSLIRALQKAHRKENNHTTRDTSGARYSLFLSFDDGMQTLTDAIAARLPQNSIRLNTRVESLAFNGAEWMIRTANETFPADAVCLALPAYAAARLVRDTDATLADELNSIEYASTATVNLAYPRADVPHPLDGFGFVVPFIERRTVLACTFSSVKFARRAPEDSVLLRAFVGGALQPENFALDDETMTDRVRHDLRELLEIERAPLFAHIERWPRSMPQYKVGHLDRIARIGSRLNNLPSLKLAGNAYAGVGIPDCIRSGEQAAEEINKESEAKRQKPE